MCCSYVGLCVLCAPGLETAGGKKRDTAESVSTAKSWNLELHFYSVNHCNKKVLSIILIIRYTSLLLLSQYKFL